jgi:hypothetical protein
MSSGNRAQSKPESHLILSSSTLRFLVEGGVRAFIFDVKVRDYRVYYPVWYRRRPFRNDEGVWRLRPSQDVGWTQVQIGPSAGWGVATITNGALEPLLMATDKS